MRRHATLGIRGEHPHEHCQSPQRAAPRFSSDYSVTIASAAFEAAHLLATFTYRLVIVTNIGMPPAHAFSVIPADHPYPELFIISGDFDDDLRRECALKRIRSMRMPFTLDKLRAEVTAARRDLGTTDGRPARPKRRPMGKRQAMKEVRSRNCPQCKAGEALPIVYGYPGAETVEAADQGKIILGGCVLAGNDPHWQCSACGHRW